MKVKRIPNEKGQSAVLIALMVVAFAAILALVLDGGMAYALRRRAQNAADAGALAGAQWMCARLDEADIETNSENKAWEYAVTLNGATIAQTDAVKASKTVTVTASIRQDSFFAGIIGTSVYTPTATAVARCFGTGGSGVLPIAWACRPPVVGLTPPQFDCREYADPNYQYLIMDSENLNVDFYCQDPPNSGLPVGSLDCDLNDDGVDEILAGGDRSWLDLDGTIGDSGSQGSSELVDWINNGFGGEIFPHTWLPDQTGVATNVFSSVWDSLLNRDVIIPVFDKHCDGDPRITGGCEWDAVDTIKEMSSASPVYYHIIGFATFHITCVYEGPHKNCPVHTLAADANIIDNNVKTIEGYFRVGHYASHGTGSSNQPWTGSYVVRLIH